MLRTRQVPQLTHSEIGQHDIVGQGVDDEFGSGARAQDLAAGGQRPQTSGAVDRPAEVVAVAQLDLAGVQGHPDPHRLGQHPRFVADRLLQLDGGGGCRRRSVEDRERRIALAARLDQPPSARRDDLFDDLVVARERHRHGVGIAPPTPPSTLRYR